MTVHKNAHEGYPGARGIPHGAPPVPCEVPEDCPVERTLRVVGGRWKALVLFHLTSRERRFNELRRLMVLDAMASWGRGGAGDTGSPVAPAALPDR